MVSGKGDVMMYRGFGEVTWLVTSGCDKPVVR